MLIGMVGFIGCGKGSAGDFLVEKMGFRHDSFAASLKDASSMIFGWDRDMLEGSTKESRAWREQVDEYWARELNDPEFTPRKALQLMGTEAGRNVFGDRLWVSGLIKRYHNNHKTPTVITDVRFRNELDIIKENNGINILIERGKNPDWYNMMQDYNNGVATSEVIEKIEQLRADKVIPHVSETDWIGWEFDSYIRNNSTIGAFENALRCIIREYV